MSDPKQFLLTVTMEDVQTAFAALAKLPWDVANPLIVKMNTQISEQIPRPAAGNEKPAPRVRPAPPPPVDAEPEAEFDDTPPAPPVRARRVQEEPDPLPRPRVNGRAAPAEPALAAEALAEPSSRRV